MDDARRKEASDHAMVGATREANTFLEIAVERVLFTIMPAYSGWQLFDDVTIGRWFTNKMSAIQAADSMAQTRHDETGLPTGIKVQMECGDWVMIGMHG